jgi:hypothetical protein
MPSPRPVKPSFSLVVALMLTASTPMPRSARQRFAHRQRVRAYFGRSQITVDRRCRLANRARRSDGMQWRRNARLSASFHCGSLGGKCLADVAQRQRTEHRIAQRVNDHVAIRVRDDSALCGIRTPPSTTVVALAKGMHVEALADTNVAHACPRVTGIECGALRMPLRQS